MQEMCNLSLHFAHYVRKHQENDQIQGWEAREKNIRTNHYITDVIQCV
jgi:hypothetical protein